MSQEEAGKMLKVKKVSVRSVVIGALAAALNGSGSVREKAPENGIARYSKDAL